MRNKNRFFFSAVHLVAFLFATVGLSACCSKHKSSIDPEWVSIPGGTYMMGYPNGQGMDKEHPIHKEKVKTFEMLKSEVTVDQFHACVQAKVCWDNPDDKANSYCNGNHLEDRGDHPMNCVDWYQAATFCAWIGGRLPTEAEWEYAARSGGKDTNAPWGNDPATCDRAAHDEHPGFNCGPTKDSTSPVCSHPKGNSEQGVCDLIGNVIEWNYDWFYHDYNYARFKEVPKTYSGATKEEAYHHVMRGGGLGSTEPLNARNRTFHDGPFRYFGLGIRCVR
jgi:formylglycine-generating enzyme required for sulfatase activity